MAGACRMQRGLKDDHAGDCPVCLTIFDDALRRPRNLPCGHTFCTTCIDDLMEHRLVTCPTCRAAHAVPDAGQFPVSYITEAFMRMLKGATSGKASGVLAPSTPPAPGQEGSGELSRPIRLMLQKQDVKVLAFIHTYQEVQAQLNQYQLTLKGWGEQQQDLEKKLQALVDQSKATRLLVRHEESRVNDMRDQMAQGEKQLDSLMKKLRTVKIQQEVCEAIDEAKHHLEAETKRMEKCQEMFPDLHTATTMSKVREVWIAVVTAATNIQATQETASAAAGASRCSRFPTIPDFSITEKIKRDLQTQRLKVDELSSIIHKAASRERRAQETASAAAGESRGSILPTARDSSITGKLNPLQTAGPMIQDTYPLRTNKGMYLLNSGLVFAAHHREGRCYHAKICSESGREYLHALQEQVPPPHAIIVQMKDVLPATPPCTVFLDLAWPSKAPRRIEIRVSPDTLLGREFLLLCTGQRGPCYANTRLYKVMRWDQGECVLSEKYERIDEEGRSVPSLTSFDDGDYPQSSRAGDVCGGWDLNPFQNNQFSHFTIITRNFEHRDQFSGVFGEVVSGLEVVKEAAQHHTVTEVTVVDCGVVLWQ